MNNSRKVMELLNLFKWELFCYKKIINMKIIEWEMPWYKNIINMKSIQMIDIHTNENYWRFKLIHFWYYCQRKKQLSQQSGSHAQSIHFTYMRNIQIINKVVIIWMEVNNWENWEIFNTSRTKLGKTETFEVKKRIWYN